MTPTPEPPAVPHSGCTHICPECLASKHRNCDHTALCAFTDEIVPCDCDAADHVQLGVPLDLTPKDEADLAALDAEPTTANPTERAITAVQYVDRVHEVIGGGQGISVYFGAMLGQLGEWLESTDHETDFGHFSIYGVRTTEPELMEDHTIVPIGTLKLIMTARVRPSNG